MLLLQGHGGGRGVMERSDEERRRAPHAVNLDNRGLHGVPVLENESELKQLSLEHNSIRRLQHLDFHWLVMLNLYHNRIDFIHGLERLVNLRVLILAKNRITRIDGLDRCSKISVLDLHNNKIAQMSGMGHLSELRVLNLAGNQIRCIANLNGLIKLEDLNLRRNRLRSLEGIGEASRSLTKLNLSNNDIQGLSSLQALSSLSSLQWLSVESNSVSQHSQYRNETERLLPQLKTLDGKEAREREITKDDQEEEKRKIELKESKKLEEKENRESESTQNSVNNARIRWRFLKQETMIHKRRKKEKDLNNDIKENKKQGSVKNEDVSGTSTSSVPMTSSSTVTTTNTTTSASSRTLWQEGMRTLTKVGWMATTSRRSASAAPRSTPGSPTTQGRRTTTASLSSKTSRPTRPTSSSRSRPEGHRAKMSVVCGQSNIDYLDLTASPACVVCSQKDLETCFDVKIGFFNSRTSTSLSSSSILKTTTTLTPTVESENDSSSSSSCSDDSDTELTPSRSTSNLLNVTESSASSSVLLSRSTSSSRLMMTSKTADLDTSKIVEKGKDYFIEIDNNVMSIFGCQAPRFLERAMSKLGCKQVNTVQFNYMNFDDLVPLLSRFRSHFQNCAHFEFLECQLNSLGQLNALASLRRPLASLFVGQDGNALATKDWKHYAVFRLEHWGLRTVNNECVTDAMLSEANENYRRLAEAALTMLPQPVLVAVVNRLELFDTTIKSGEFRALMKDPLLRSIAAKEALGYRPVRLWDEQARLNNLKSLLKRGHEVLHARGKVEQHWDAVLASLVQRIVGQYSEMDRYKQQCLQRMQQSKN